MATVKHTSQRPKRARVPSDGLTSQNKKDLECILGICNHTITSKTCLYWNKVVDSEDPGRVQYKLIERIWRKK